MLPPKSFVENFLARGEMERCKISPLVKAAAFPLTSHLGTVLAFEKNA